MGSSANKKVRVLRFERGSLHGFVQSNAFQTATGVELLTTDGAVSVLPYADIKAVCFVNSFDDAPAALNGARFISRPKAAGLWVRMRFRDGHQMDGLLANSLLHIDAHGFMVSPPDQGINPQRVFIPKAALSEFAVLAVVGSGTLLNRGRKKVVPGDDSQTKLFDT